MDISNKYTRTDLACESGGVPDKTSDSGIRYDEYSQDGIEVGLLTVINEVGEETTGRRKGRYYTINCGRIWLWDEDRIYHVSSVIAEHIVKITEEITGKKITPDFKVLVTGLGNCAITADAVGPNTVDMLTVTRHVKNSNRLIFDSIGCCELSAIKPGVLGQTGIESSELIMGAVEFVKPDVILAIDALAARSCDRLASTVQIADNGIHPGSGIGNRRNAITKETVGVPVIALGVPTVVDSSTLVYDALERAGIDEDDISDELKKVLDNGKSFFVSLKESDVIITDIAGLLSESIEKAFSLNHEFGMMKI